LCRHGRGRQRLLPGRVRAGPGLRPRWQQLRGRHALHRGRSPLLGATYQNCSAGRWEPVTDCGALGCSKERGGCLRSAGQACEVDADCGEGSLPGHGRRQPRVLHRRLRYGVPPLRGRRHVLRGDRRRCTPAAPSHVRATRCGRSYDPSTVTTNRCHAGQCATPAEACTNFQPQRADLECGESSLVATIRATAAGRRKGLLASCSAGSECQSSACVAHAERRQRVVATRRVQPVKFVAPPAAVSPAAGLPRTHTTQCSGSSFPAPVSGGSVAHGVRMRCPRLPVVAREGCLGGRGRHVRVERRLRRGAAARPRSGGGSVCCTAACDGAVPPLRPRGQRVVRNLADDAACGCDLVPGRLHLPGLSCQCQRPALQRGPLRVCRAAAVRRRAPVRVGQVCSAHQPCAMPLATARCRRRALGVACSSGAECALGQLCLRRVLQLWPATGYCSTCSAPVASAVPRPRIPAAARGCAPARGSARRERGVRLRELPHHGCVCCSELSAEERRACSASRQRDLPSPSRRHSRHPDQLRRARRLPTGRGCCRSGTSTSSELSCKLPQPSPGTMRAASISKAAPRSNPMLFGDQCANRRAGVSRYVPAFEDCAPMNELRFPGSRSVAATESRGSEARAPRTLTSPVSTAIVCAHGLARQCCGPRARPG
jgi:hypothetical protein